MLLLLDKKQPDEVYLNQLTDLLGIRERLTHLPHELSGGQQQRVAIARVVAIRAKLMLLDEPLSNLDAKLRRQVRVEIKELQRKLKITTVIVTHDQEEAMTLGDRIAILNEGRIQQIGSPMELYEKPANQFVAGFLGTPSINFMNMEIQNGKCFIEGSAVEDKYKTTAMKKLSDGKYTVGIRPEHISVIEKEAEHFLVEAPVTLVENLGSETLVYFHINEKKYCSKMARTIRMEPGKKVQLSLELEHATLFDADGNSIL